MMQITDLFKLTLEKNASDLHIKVGSPPLLRIDGQLLPTDLPPLKPDDTKSLIYSILSEEQVKTLEHELELDIAYNFEQARFRINVFWQRGSLCSVSRVIPFHIKTIDELGLPQILKEFSLRPRGLLLVTGPAGSGKSTTLAAIIDYINSNKRDHIVTIEDPIEFIHKDKKSIINQREVNSDTNSFSSALKYVLRQDPDVILVGEMRDLETISSAVTAAETGHFVLSTLHTTGAATTVDRIIDVFPPYQQQQVRMQLSVNLVGVISQILVRRRDGLGRIPAFEILVGTPAVKSLIREGKTYQIPSIIQMGSQQGMISLDQYLALLCRRGVVDYEEALSKSANPEGFKKLLSL